MMDDGYMTRNAKWTEWRERFAFFPTKIIVSERYRWIWFRRYWERYRYDMLGFAPTGQPYAEMDYALNIFDILRKR